ncbi:MAG: RNA polymerase sigma factor RpoH [Zoogloea oleivorans]|jgi:RNA polymerase sigma-32 factor|uniref:RNA polymerase sigma factor RpoH n=1 Tax=Zoogloea oleivorans TaxID=1552750 RepID=UPI002A358B2D|nr:RNA polymerase sigma factor RpoH [Zoogloea oleivorans]MDY0037994.1 RNA polymerase sigma factor RpoH [Zoogloea oleivorans]
MSQTLSFPVPSAVGSLDQYIQSVNRIPLLTEKEESDLAHSFREQDDLEAARKLVLSHLRLVVAIARGYLGYGLPHADLIQEGNVGLMKAVKRFDPERGVRLVSFAIHWIKAEIHEYIVKNWRLVKIATTKAQRKLFFNLRSMKSSSSTLQGDAVLAVAQQLGVKPEEVREMETRLSGQDMALESGPDDEEERFAPIAYLADPNAEPSEVLAQRQYARLQDEGLHQALAGLDERSRTIVQRRWLAEGDSATLHELAAEYGVSAERIRQIEVKAMQKMRTQLAALA